MEEYRPNSHKSKTEIAVPEKKVEKVVKGEVKIRKKSGFSKLVDTFISEDASNVGSYVLMDVLVPAVKKAISDIVKDGIDMFLYGGRSGGSSSHSTVDRVSYRKYSDSRPDDRRRDEGSSRRGYEHDDIVLETRGEAEEVLLQMDALIDTYGQVSVADMYDLVGKRCNFTDNNYGWRNIRNAEPIRVRDGFMLKLPRPIPID